MSYEILKKIEIKDNKVFITSHANNVWPRTNTTWECTSLMKILKEQGREALDIEILQEFDKGNFQGHISKYKRALAILRHMPEYKKYDWRGDWEEYKKNEQDVAGYHYLLKKALHSKLPKEKWIISKDYYGTKQYLFKITNRWAKWCQERMKAKVFHWEEDAIGLKKCFSGSGDWQTERVS